MEELSSIPGIGWDRALAIQDYRDQNGQFVSVNELLRVPGIGQHELGAIRNQVTVTKQGPRSCPDKSQPFGLKPEGWPHGATVGAGRADEGAWNVSR
ncbi:MAG: helix-hairpin-helix domain-containing protein [Deltaproteobacteria bacterium]|nr:helix-hairpin-helix domain-containing protein [Deltaproteobacteria bacterium]